MKASVPALGVETQDGDGWVLCLPGTVTPDLSEENHQCLAREALDCGQECPEPQVPILSGRCLVLVVYRHRSSSRGIWTSKESSSEAAAEPRSRPARDSGRLAGARSYPATTLEQGPARRLPYVPRVVKIRLSQLSALIRYRPRSAVYLPPRPVAAPPRPGHFRPELMQSRVRRVGRPVSNRVVCQRVLEALFSLDVVGQPCYINGLDAENHPRRPCRAHLTLPLRGRSNKIR